MQIFNIRIKGTTSLLQNRFNEESEVNKSTRAVLMQKRPPREEAEKSCYRMPSGELYFPGQAISRLLRESGSNHKLKGSRRSAKYIVPSAILVLVDTIVLLEEDGITPKTNFEVDSRPVVIPATKGRVMRHRPRHDQWAANFSLRINEEILNPDFIHQLLVEGGQQIGIGDFRPEKGGPFGTFIVTLWDKI